MEARRQNLLRKELAWLRRGPPARTSKPKFRQDAALALIDDEPPPRDRLALQRVAMNRLGKKVLDLEDVALVPRPDAAPVLRAPDLGDRAGRPDRPARAATVPARRRLLRLLVGPVAADAGTASGGARPCAPALVDQRLPAVDADDRVLPWLKEVGNRVVVAAATSSPRRSCSSSSASPVTRPGSGSATCPAANCAGCTCCARSCPGPTC